MTSTKLTTTSHLNSLFSKTNYHPIKIIHTKISLQLWDETSVKSWLIRICCPYRFYCIKSQLVHVDWFICWVILLIYVDQSTTRHVNNCVRILSSISLIQHFSSAKFEENWSGIYDFRPCLKHFIYTFSNTKKSIWLMTTLNYFQQRKVIT